MMISEMMWLWQGLFRPCRSFQKSPTSNSLLHKHNKYIYNTIMKHKPKFKAFTSMAEVDDYFAQDPLPCLICGKSYHGLPQHIQAAHKMSAEEYKALFGIPWTRGLISPSLKKKLSDITHENRAKGILLDRPSDEHIAKLSSLSKNNRRPMQSVVKKAISDNALNIHKRTEKLKHTDYEEFLRRVATGRTLSEVAKDPDMMWRETFEVYSHQHPEFRAKLENVLDNLPINVQLRGQRTGKTFKQLIVFMREVQGKTWPQIASILSINEANGRSTYHRLKTQGKLDEYRIWQQSSKSDE
jgi:ROS/MUCR transcriptional regulator protein